jgi:hypothetical protein
MVCRRSMPAAHARASSPARAAAHAVGALLTGAVTALPLPAAAYEDQLTLEAGLGYAHATDADADTQAGLPFSLAASIGLDDVWTVKALGSYALHPAVAGTRHVVLAGAELVYVIDVLELVPYFGAGLDVFAAWRAPTQDLDAAAHLVFGADYLLTRRLFVGLEIRPYLLLTRLGHDDGRTPLYVTALARIGVSWEL